MADILDELCEKPQTIKKQKKIKEEQASMFEKSAHRIMVQIGAF